MRWRGAHEAAVALRYVSGMADLSNETPGGIYLLAAHPNWRDSRVNRRLLAAARAAPGVDVQDLYGSYADYDIDVAAEQTRAQAARMIVLLHPIQWYSMPALMKLWVDDVLAHGWAYGTGGDALRGKDLWLVATTGGPESSYRAQGYNRFSIEAFLPPYRQTAALCGMRFVPPLLLYGAHTVSDEAIEAHVQIFEELLKSHPHWPRLAGLDAYPGYEVPGDDRPHGHGEVR